MERSVKILGIGQDIPGTVVSNEQIARVAPGSDSDWIELKLGIKSRGMATGYENVVSLGTNAAYDALKDAGVHVFDISLIIVNTSSPNKLSPSVACQIQYELGAKCPAFDINAVCSGFIYALDLASTLLDRYKNILIISTEAYSTITDYQDKNSCYFGDGAAAVVIRKGEKNNFSSEIGADGHGRSHFECKVGSTFKMNGKEVYAFGTEVLPRVIQRLLYSVYVMKKIEDIDYLVPHQPSHNVLKETARKLRLPEDKVIFNMNKYGNTAGASVPMALYELIKNRGGKTGDTLILAAIGSGWTYGAAVMILDYK